MSFKNEIYTWRIPESYPNKFIGEYCADKSPDRFLFKKAMEIEPGEATAYFMFNTISEKLAKYDCLPNTSRIPLVNGRVAQILMEECKNDVQLFRAVVSTLNGTLDDYYLVNITVSVFALDRENSEFRLIPDTEAILSFTRIRYMEGCLLNHHIARNREYTSHILVSSKLREIFKKEKVSGVSFVEYQEIEGP